jgi:hypothetical protein
LGSGGFKAIMINEPTLATHTVYRPADLNANGLGKLPIVLWGNGACRNAGNSFRPFLTDIASYGYFIVALGPIVPESEIFPTPPGAPIPPPATNGPRVLPPAATHPVQLFQGLDWAINEDKRTDSPYFGKLDVNHIAVMGQSCGGVQAIEAAVDPRITTAVIWNSGLLPEPTAMGGGKTLSKEWLGALHAPMAYISGDAQDVAFFNANDDFKRIDQIPVFRGWERGIPHGGTYREPNGGEFSGIGVAWLNWQLRGNQLSSKMFAGKDCGLCTNPKWVVSKKKID